MSNTMDLYTALPPQLVHSLTNPYVPIKASAELFLSLKAVLGNEFPRACQLKNTLDQVEDQQQLQRQKNASIAKSQGHGVIGSGKPIDGAGGASANAEAKEYKLEYSDGRYVLKMTDDEFCALLLNAEFVLVKMYSEYGIRRNPFLIRWLELYQKLLDDYLDGEGGSDDESGRRSGVGQRSDVELKLVKVRATFIEAILNEVQQVSFSR